MASSPSQARMSAQEHERHNLRQRRYYQQAPKPGMRPTGAPYLQRHVDQLLHFGGISAGDHVLEIGCGMGRYTLILAARGVRVEGLDLSPELLDRLRAFDGGQYDIPLHCADIVQYPPELEGQFDAVIGFFTLHHLHDLTECFAAMARLARPGGRVVFLEPNPFNSLYYVQMAVTPDMTWEGDRGLIAMRPGRVRHAMHAAGLRRLASRRFGFLPPFLMNQPWGPSLEAVLERVPLWQACLPFQLFRGERP
jgi:SAM-dependent methyltransferase